jgi:hypothetical protein
MIRGGAEPNGAALHPNGMRRRNSGATEHSAKDLIDVRNNTMKTIKSQLKELCKEKIVDMNEFRFLKRLDNVRKYFGIPPTKVVRSDDGAWFRKT